MSDKAFGFVLGVGAALAVAVYLKRRHPCGCGSAGAEHTYFDDDDGDDDVDDNRAGLFGVSLPSLSSLFAPSSSAPRASSECECNG